MAEPIHDPVFDVGALARLVLDSDWPLQPALHDLAVLLLTAPRPPSIAAEWDRADTPVPDFVATLTDEERTLLRDLIDAELARRQTEEAASDDAPAPHDDLIVRVHQTPILKQS